LHAVCQRDNQTSCMSSSSITVPLKCNVASAREWEFVCTRIIANKSGMAHEWNVCHASFIYGVNTCERNMCHAPFISGYSRVSKGLLVSTCDVALEQYHRHVPMLCTQLVWLATVNWIHSAYQSWYFLWTQMIRMYISLHYPGVVVLRPIAINVTKRFSVQLVTVHACNQEKLMHTNSLTKSMCN